MKNIKTTTLVLLTGLMVLLTSVTIPTAKANVSNTEPIHYNISDTEISTLLTYYSIADEVPLKNTTVKIFDKNDNLIFSDRVCQNLSECDERLNHFINQSDFLIEVDNTKIYILNQ